VASLGAVVVVNFAPFGSGRRKIDFPGKKGGYPEPSRGQTRKIAFSAMPASAPYGLTLDALLEQLRGAECSKIYREKVTSAHSDRRELLKMLDQLAPGDVVRVSSLYCAYTPFAFSSRKNDIPSSGGPPHNRPCWQGSVIGF
jgi:hypothetical protein